MPQVRISQVTHHYAEQRETLDGRTCVVKDVSLEIAKGEFLGIIGPSGCGKTTLLNLLAGFIAPTEGEVWIDEEQVAGPRGNRVSFMFARDNLFPWLTAAANVALPMQLGRRRSRSRKQAHAEAKRLLARVGLGQAPDKYPAELSHGMRQRAALARTLATKSEVILMDEPFGALDAQTRVLVQDEFARICDQEKPTVLMVTHDLTEAIALSDRIVVMTNRPARIKAIYEVDIPRPRVVMDLPRMDEFHRLYSALWEDLRGELKTDSGSDALASAEGER